MARSLPAKAPDARRYLIINIGQSWLPTVSIRTDLTSRPLALSTIAIAPPVESPVLIMMSDEVDVHSTASVLAVAVSSTVSCAVPGGKRARLWRVGRRGG